ncbi:MAG: hypothetical protein HYX53_16165 [Chloroflexi bacterium]|nr:hypothetical protein [Chloroflexota bacterium]
MLSKVIKRLGRKDTVFYIAGAMLAGSAWLAAWGWTSVSADDPKVGPIRDVKDIPPDVQSVLEQAAAPTNSEPTPWGLFVINPVINGAGVLNPQRSPIPEFSGPSAKRLEARGEQAFAQASAAGLPVVNIPPALVKGMPLNGLISEQDGAQFNFGAYYASGDGTANYFSLVVQAYTPRDPVTFDEFPDNAIRDFSQSAAIRGYPTLMVLPDKVTADPRGERIVAWSQGTAVYWVKTTGRFTDDEVLELARKISESEEGQR